MDIYAAARSVTACWIPTFLHDSSADASYIHADKQNKMSGIRMKQVNGVLRWQLSQGPTRISFQKVQTFQPASDL
jgi:hypothetical protein